MVELTCQACGHTASYSETHPQCRACGARVNAPRASFNNEGRTSTTRMGGKLAAFLGRGRRKEPGPPPKRPAAPPAPVRKRAQEAAAPPETPGFAPHREQTSKLGGSLKKFLAKKVEDIDDDPHDDVFLVPREKQVKLGGSLRRFLAKKVEDIDDDPHDDVFLVPREKQVKLGGSLQSFLRKPAAAPSVAETRDEEPEAAAPLASEAPQEAVALDGVEGREAAAPIDAPVQDAPRPTPDTAVTARDRAAIEPPPVPVITAQDLAAIEPPAALAVEPHLPSAPGGSAEALDDRADEITEALDDSDFDGLEAGLDLEFPDAALEDSEEQIESDAALDIGALDVSPVDLESSPELESLEDSDEELESLDDSDFDELDAEADGPADEGALDLLDDPDELDDSDFDELDALEEDEDALDLEESDDDSDEVLPVVSGPAPTVTPPPRPAPVAPGPPRPARTPSISFPARKPAAATPPRPPAKPPSGRTDKGRKLITPSIIRPKRKS